MPELTYDGSSNERRRLELAARFRYHSSDTVIHTGYGCTVVLSRQGILLITQEPPPVGVAVELWIEWPFLLQNICPLELIVEGRVLQSADGWAVVENRHHEFRTCGDRSFAEMGPAPSTSTVA
jgi:hypothetical protein